jgi:preprotein translocase subunit SecD
VEYQALPKDGQSPSPESMGVIKDIIERRVNQTGVSEPVVVVQGSDRVTNMMLSQLNAAQEQSLDAPAVRAKVLERFDRDAAVALERGDVVREDLQRARQLFSEGGFKALRDNLGKGLLPAGFS